MVRFFTALSRLLCLTIGACVGLLLWTTFESINETKAPFKFMAEHDRNDPQYIQELQRLNERLLKDMDKRAETNNRCQLIIGCAAVLQIFVAIGMLRRPRPSFPPQS
ncbi:hypothetical protein [Prosthecobacter sp.]|uniref:hypothetical protein n=1 Tax=Prosthecobacter sp. TaxID=1965333 RepID=UPI003784AC9D